MDISLILIITSSHGYLNLYFYIHFLSWLLVLLCSFLIMATSLVSSFLVVATGPSLATGHLLDWTIAIISFRLLLYNIIPKQQSAAYSSRSHFLRRIALPGIHSASSPAGSIAAQSSTSITSGKAAVLSSMKQSQHLQLRLHSDHSSYVVNSPDYSIYVVSSACKKGVGRA